MAQKNVTRDMTQGSPLKLILTFSLPLLGGFLFQQLAVGIGRQHGGRIDQRCRQRHKQRAQAQH